jgi:hypothetical protein
VSGRTRAAAAAALLALLSAAPAAACSVCFGTLDNDSPLVDAAKLGVFLLLGVTVAVLGGMTRFFFHLRTRAKQAESDGIAAEWTDLQRGATS